MRQEKTSDIIRLIFAGLFEHFGFHQFHVFCRLMGIYDLLVRGKLAYGYRERSGYKSQSSPLPDQTIQ